MSWKTKFVAAAVSAVFSMVSVRSAFAETAYWSNTNKVSGSGIDWLTPANFTNENGVVYSEPPTNGHHLVFNALEELPAAKSYKKDSDIVMHQTVGAGSGKIPSPRFGSISGQDRYTLMFHDYTVASQYYSPESVRTITVDNPNDFLGYWLSGGMLTTFALSPTEEFTPVMRNVSTSHRPVMQVPQNEARIDFLYGGGSLEKRGAGNLHIASFSGEDGTIYLKEGSLTLEGADGAELEKLLAKAALHLDASAEGTLVTSMREGYESVYRWSDVRGEEGYYYATNSTFIGTKEHQIPFTVPPYVSADAVSPTGLPFVDFGSRCRSDALATDFPSRGPTNCMLIINARITGIKAVFYTASNPNGMFGASVLGDTESHPFITSGGNMLYCATYSDPAVRYGFITLNGKKSYFSGIDASLLKKTYTCGNLLQRDVAVGLLGSREYYRDQTGGTRMGEVLLFTNELTKAESALITRYLDSKWRTDDDSHDIGAIMTSADTADLTVPEGSTFSVRSLESAGGLVKRGGGTLEVGSLYPDGTCVTVEGGTVAFTGEEVSSEAPAADPYIWLDASAEGVFTEVESEESGKNYISAWKDVRSGCDLSATSVSNEPPHMPHVVMSDICNRKVVDFGKYAGNSGGNDDFAWMQLPNWSSDSHNSYSAFMIFRFPVSVYNAVIFGSSTFASYRDAASSIISPKYLSAVPGAAVWAVNGRTVDPFSCADPTATDGFILVSVRTAIPMRYDTLSKDRMGKSDITYAGGHQIGEVILYDRPLSAAEHRDTEAYLMKKWLNLDHPSLASTTVPEMKFGSAVDTVIDTDGDMEIESLSGGNGELVKKGFGTLKVENVAAGDFGSIAVEDGTLRLAVTNRSFLAEAAFHFDAASPETFAETEVIGGETNLLSWSSRSGELTADAFHNTVAKTNPVLRTVETAPGVMRQVVDFGEYCSSTNDVVTAGIGAAMHFSERFRTIRELAQVSADAHGSNKQWIWGDDSRGCHYARGTGGMLYSQGSDAIGAASSVRNAFTWIDGGRVSATTVVPAGFHNFQITLSNGSAIWDTAVGALACGKDVMAGGMYIAETMGFERMLTADERDTVKRYLDWKWFAKAKPAAVLTNEIESVTLCEGSRLELEAADELVTFKIEAFEGCGNYAGDAVGVSSLTTSVREDGVPALIVEGDVEFADEVTVNVVSDGGELPPDGEYTLFTAENTNLGDVRLVLNDTFSDVRNVSLKVEDDSIILKISPKGFTVIVR